MSGFLHLLGITAIFASPVKCRHFCYYQLKLYEKGGLPGQPSHFKPINGFLATEDTEKTRKNSLLRPYSVKPKR